MKQQNGSSLVVVAIMIGVISIVGLISARLALFGERSSRNDRDRQIAFQSAEAALLDAETDIWGPNSSASSRVCDIDSDTIDNFRIGTTASAPCQSGTSAGLCFLESSQGNAWKTVIGSYSSNSGTATANVTAQFGQFTGASFPLAASGLTIKLPRYTIEAVPYTGVGEDGVDGKFAFLVTAMGFGLNTKTQVVLQSLIYKPAQRAEAACTPK